MSHDVPTHVDQILQMKNESADGSLLNGLEIRKQRIQEKFHALAEARLESALALEQTRQRLIEEVASDDSLDSRGKHKTLERTE